MYSVSWTLGVWKGFTLHFLPLETSDTAVQWYSRLNVTLKRAKTAERNSTTCECIFHQFAVKNVNVSVVITIYCQHNWISLRQKKIISIHYLTGQNRGLSRLKNIWPFIMTGNLLSVIFSPALKQSVRKAGSQSASQSVSRSVSQSIRQAVSQSVRQAGRQPVCQLGRLASNQACRQSVRQAGPGRQAVIQSVSLSGRQADSQSVSQSVSSQADGQAVSHSSSEVSTGTDELSLLTNSP